MLCESELPGRCLFDEQRSCEFARGSAYQENGLHATARQRVQRRDDTKRKACPCPSLRTNGHVHHKHSARSHCTVTTDGSVIAVSISAKRATCIGRTRLLGCGKEKRSGVMNRSVLFSSHRDGSGSVQRDAGAAGAAKEATGGLG